MDTHYFFNGLQFIKPELVISLFLIMILVWDLAWPNAKKMLPWIAGVGLLTALVFVVQQFYVPMPASFIVGNMKSMIAVDNFGSYFKIIVLISSFFVTSLARLICFVFKSQN